ncbi:putative Type IV pilus protein PilM [Pseudomonas savastanoi]|nr:type IV pilus biogenesis protein PilM [Pseudomonas syringae]KPX10174.1 putative Type IV pilus protein PilM [Pseudomonas syringae pv. cunninghamiae]RMV07879.1 putative Type IV pilus protein PilM [Pseudomonas savastanoi]RMT65579.1 putative Type IV pilus protein PilM [Pseudomonas syringae pv. theae]RMV15621.1 putative Type IV pilus protein PilM [Pseudomonas savastanoi]RMV16609.1 putative Type IV pilus protein PilM [Pseudomonas savastanoi]
MINLTGGSLAIGTALAGSLVTPSSGNLGVTLPATVPNGAAVAYQ